MDARAHGALGVARNDDWAFLRVTWHLADTGVFRLNGWPQMAFVGQAVVALPVVAIFGRSVVALQVLVALLGACGVSWSYLILRRFLSVGLAVLACAALLLGPIFGSLSVSFMTDVPAFALMALTLLLGLEALERRVISIPLLLGSAAAGLLAASVREYAVAAFGAVLIVALRAARRERARALSARLIKVALGFGSALAVLLLWRHSLPHDFSTTLIGSVDHVTNAVGSTLPRALMTAAVLVVPATLVVSPRRLWWRSWHASRAGTITALVAGAVLVLAAGSEPFVGNYLTQRGSYPAILSGHAPELLGGPRWSLVRVAAGYSLVVALLIAVVAVRGRRSAHTPAVAITGVFCLLLAVLHAVAVMFTNAPFGDRYLIVFVPFVMGLLLSTIRDEDLFVRTPTRLPVVLGIVVFVFVGLVFVDASATLDGAEWRAGERAEALGIPAATIDGGFAWFGYHQAARDRSRGRHPRSHLVDTAVRPTSGLRDRRICANGPTADPRDADRPQHPGRRRHACRGRGAGSLHPMTAAA